MLNEKHNEKNHYHLNNTIKNICDERGNSQKVKKLIEGGP